MNREQAVVGQQVVYRQICRGNIERYGMIMQAPKVGEDLVEVRLPRGYFLLPLKDLSVAAGPLAHDGELITAMARDMKFVEDSLLKHYGEVSIVRKYDLIRYFEQAYSDTDQDTVVYAPEFVIVVRSILEGKRPVKLRFLTDFDGEEK